MLMCYVVSGFYPFRGDTERAQYKSDISAEAEDLIHKLLVEDPDLRMDAEAALKHPWISRVMQESRQIDERILNSLKEFHLRTAIQREALRVVIKYASTEDIFEIRKAFENLDLDAAGYLTFA